MRASHDGKVYASDPLGVSTLASRSVINETYPSTVLTCTASGGTPPYTYQWWEMNPDASYSEISGANSANYTFTANNLNTTGVWKFKVQVTDFDGTNVTSFPVQVTNGQKVPAPDISTGTPGVGGGVLLEGYAMGLGYPSWANFSFSFDVRKYIDITSNLVLEYQGNANSYVSGTQLLFQFTLMSSIKNGSSPASFIYINCSGDVIPIYLYNCSSFDMVTSNVTYVGNVPTVTNVITFHDIALQTYGRNASSISLVFTQHFIADWTELKVKTETYADLTNMTLYYSNQSAVPSNTKFSLNFDYKVGLFNQTPTDQYGSIEIPPTSMTQTGLYYDVKGTGGMQYSLADMTLDDNYTEVQGATQIPNKTAIAYFSGNQGGGIDCFQRFTDLTYGVTTAIRSDPTVSVTHSQVPWSATGIPEINNVGVTIGAAIVILVSIVLLKKKKIRGTS